MMTTATDFLRHLLTLVTAFIDRLAEWGASLIAHVGPGVFAAAFVIIALWVLVSIAAAIRAPRKDGTR